MKVLLLAATALFGLVATAHAQSVDLSTILPQAGGTASGRIVQLVGLLTVLSIAPGLLVMVTSFTRFAIAFSFLRSGLGLQTTPANLILVSLSLFMTFYVMAPPSIGPGIRDFGLCSTTRSPRPMPMPRSPSPFASSCWRRCARRI